MVRCHRPDEVAKAAEICRHANFSVPLLGAKWALMSGCSRGAQRNGKSGMADMEDEAIMYKSRRISRGF